MPTYRVYRLDPEGRITWGEWFEARNDAAARRVGRSHCEPGVPAVEIWKSAKCIWRYRCKDPPPPSPPAKLPS